MRWRIRTWVASSVLVAGLAAAGEEAPAGDAAGPGAAAGETSVRPSIESQTVMLYYADLAAPAAFYGEVLGLENTLNLDWVKFFKTGPGGTIGLVRAEEGYHPVRAENSVMVSLVTKEIDAWYARLKSRSGIVFLKDLQDGELVRSFLLADPGGYTVEFYQWQQPSE